MLPMLRSAALGLACLTLGAAIVTSPASAASSSAKAAASRGGEVARSAGADPSGPVPDDITEGVAHDGTPFVKEKWNDPNLSTDLTGADAGDGTEVTAAEAEPLIGAALSDTFTLHSRPGASRSIFLDFNGGSLLSSNSWLLNGLTSLVYPGWSLDSSTAFSSSELTIIQEVWARIAEDYAPFDIDVTTQEPAAGGLWRSGSTDTTYGTRIAFTGGTLVQSGVCGGPCGGIAWIGTFDSVTKGETRSPAWVFPSSLGNRAKTMAEAASHEAGHTLGLTHDGTSSSSYYSGTSLWGPLMGSPYSSGVTQWSRGSYVSANNTQDDAAVMVSNGLPARPDEAGDTAATATPLTSLPGHRGVITSRTDVDWYSVDQCSGTVVARATPAAVGPNLDIGLEVHAADGRLLASAAPVTTRTSSGITGMDATISIPLSGGPFYVAVRGTGSGSSWSAGGYDNYGSLGSYTVDAGGCLGSPPATVVKNAGTTPAAARPGRVARPAIGSGARGGARTVGVRWRAPSAGGSRITGYQVVAYRLDSRGRVTRVRTTTVLGSSVRSVRLAVGSGRWAVAVKARNGAGWGTASVRSRAVTAR